LEEGIKGVENDPLICPLERTSSPGWRWNTLKKVYKTSAVGKTYWLGEAENYKTDNVELVEAINYRLKRAQKGVRTPAYWTDTLKDERRPIAKVDSGKTRLFSSGEMDFNILFRMFFGGFMAHCAEYRIDIESCVGVNVYSQEWSFIARRIQSKGEHVVAGDFTNFDGTLNGSILWKICEIINNWYADGEENKRVRNVLWSEIVHSIHISKDMCYGWNHSQPSGNPATVIINCLYNSLSVRLCWSILVSRLPTLQRADYVSMKAFNKHVAMVAYGDDNVLNISAEVLPWFNMETLVLAFAEFGMIYTDELKSGKIIKSKKLEEIQFLKRSFRYDLVQKRYRAPLTLETILEMPNWYRKCVDPDTAVGQILEDAIHELAQHDEETYDEHIGKFINACKKVENSPRLETYKSYQLVEFSRYAA
jgi:hypothetical protein